MGGAARTNAFQAIGLSNLKSDLYDTFTRCIEASSHWLSYYTHGYRLNAPQRYSR